MENKNTKTRMIPYGVDFDKIPKEEPMSKAIITANTSRTIQPTKPHSYECSYFAQPIQSLPQPLLIKDAPTKGPFVKVPAGTKILSPKSNEVLMGVKTNKSGEVICAKYSKKKRTTIEGVRASSSKIKIIPPAEAPKRSLAASEAPRKRRKTVADLEKELEALRETVIALELSNRIQDGTIRRNHEDIRDLRKANEALEKKIEILELFMDF
jgi:hypothetical protein